MGKLTSKGRAGLRTSQFALPGKRAYPVEDRGHAEEAIHVAGIQHARGKLSEAQEKTVDAKAEHVLHAANGGFMEKPKGLRRDASNVSKNFTRKSQANLRPVKMADGGPVDAATIAKQAGFPMTPPNPAINPTVVASTPQPSNPHTEPMHTTTIGVRGANGGHVSIRHAMRAGATGAVRGPGGPTADKVPAMLSNGEYVLPAKTVAHIGRDNLDNLVRSTNDGHEPGMQPQHFADGGEADGIPKLTDPAPASAVPGQGLHVPPDIAREGVSMYRTPPTPQASIAAEPSVKYGPETDATPSAGLRKPYGSVNGNPNVSGQGTDFDPTTGARPQSAEAAAWEAQQAARAAPAAPGAAPAAAAPKSGGIFGSTDDWKRMGNSARNAASEDLANSGRLTPGAEAGAGIVGKGLRAVGKYVKPLAVVTGAGETASGLAHGDVGKTALGAADTVAGAALYTPAAPIAATYLAGRTGMDAGKALYDHASPETQSTIGGVVNQIGLNTGFYGRDDSAQLEEAAAQRMGLRSVNGRQPGTPQPGTAPQPVNTDVSSNESNGLEMQPDTNPALPNAPGSASVTGVDANGIRTIGYDGSPGSRDAATARYEDAAAHPQFDPSHVYVHDADGNLIDEGRGDSPSYQARYNEARARALDPAYSEAGIRAMHDDVDAKYGSPSDDVAAAGLRAGNGTWSQKFANARMMATRMAMAKMAVEERNNQRTAQVAMAGHQLSADATNAGHVLTAQAANARLAQEQAEHQRTFDADQRRLYGDPNGGGATGGSEGRANDEAKAKGEQEIRTKIASMIPPAFDANGKPVPNDVVAAGHMNSLNALVGQRVMEAKQRLAQNPNDTATRDWLREYNQRGVRALGDDQIRKFVVGMEAARIAQENSSGWDPYEGKAVVSDAPITSLTRENHWWRPDMYRSNRGDTIRATALDRPGSTLGVGGQVNQNFDPLKKGLRQ